MTFRPEDMLQPPRASAMCESMRSLGYTAGSAVADLVDNSIAASARNVWISLAQAASGGRRLAILDDGVGMTADALLAAMRPGSRSPIDSRAPGDLGRFGLGLKTASFSQCRCLSVASRGADRKINVLRWDLDHVAKTDRWELIEGPEPDVEPALGLLEELAGTGTLVIWTKLDRLSPDDAEVISHLRQHLSLRFHRLLEASDLRLYTSMDDRHRNPSSVAPVDPFLRGNEATRVSPVETIDRGCTLRGYVLPHRDRCTEKEWETGALGTSWRDRQGCYVYRNRRLLVAGGWLGLDRRWKRDPETQLARVQIDFDNTWDERWKLDVMKSRATPPRELRARLRHLARLQREGSANVFKYRRRRVGGAAASHRVDGGLGHLPLWQSETSAIGTRFRISQQHPAVRRLLESSPLGAPVIRLIEEALPVWTIWSDLNARITDGIDMRAEQRSLAQLRLDLVTFVDYECVNGRTVAEVIAEVRRMAPYDEIPEIVDSVAAELGAG